MTSFVADILLTAGNLEKIELRAKAIEIEKEIIKLKHDVKEFMDDNYVEFVPRLKKDQALAKEAEKIINEMRILQKRVDDQVKIELSGSRTELKNLSWALQELNISLQLSTYLLEMNECIKAIEKSKQENKLVETARILYRMHHLLSDSKKHMQHLEIYSTLENEFATLYGSFVTETASLWQELICWNEESEEKETITSLTIESEPEKIQDTILALHYVDRLSNFMDTLTVNLLKGIINPIISCECLVHVVEEKRFIVKMLNKTRQSGYKSVFYNLKLLFKFLNQNINIELGGRTFMERLRCYLLTDFSKALIKNCIADTIPNSSAELKTFHPIVEDINEFQDYLTEIGFISNEHRFLSEYTRNIDSLFVNKICQGLLVRARDLMKKDLHESIRIEPQNPPSFPDEILDEYDLKSKRKLSEVTFQLPPCRISKSAQELLDLGKEILEEACKNSDECAIRLFYTSRNVFEMYAGLVPEHHKKFLETIPQQVALFHNNCMYFAHNLLTLAHEYEHKLPKILKQYNVTYADQTLMLRKVGVEHILNHMKTQRDLIFDILKKSGLAIIRRTPELPYGTGSEVRQCLRQLELLKTVWLDVLPSNIYCRAVGHITNSMVEDIISKITAVEDIPADMASDLVFLLEMIVERISSIFPEPEMIHKYVRTWRKLQELISVLGGSLTEIETRWANSKGPLAHEFNADQVKRLIRALFQNTERRSALLSKIK